MMHYCTHVSMRSAMESSGARQQAFMITMVKLRAEAFVQIFPEPKYAKVLTLVASAYDVLKILESPHNQPSVSHQQ